MIMVLLTLLNLCLATMVVRSYRLHSTSGPSGLTIPFLLVLAITIDSAGPTGARLIDFSGCTGPIDSIGIIEFSGPLILVALVVLLTSVLLVFLIYTLMHQLLLGTPD